MYEELGKEYLKDIKKIGRNLKNNYLLPIVSATMLYACGGNSVGSGSHNSGGVNPIVYQCNDNKDNDSDSLTDMLDPGCTSSTDDDEYNVPPIVYACNDSQDNDGDTLVDMLDPGCSSASDNDEYNVPVNQAPVITSTPNLEILVHSGYVYNGGGIWGYNFNNYQYDINAADPENDLITYYLTQAPLGMTINSTNGLIEFPLSFNDLGKHNVTVAADDGNSQTEQNFILDVRYPYIDEFGNTVANYDFVKGNDERVLICESPCSFGFTYPVNLEGNIITSDEDYFNKKWKGINLGADALTAFTGVTPIPTYKPVEVHLKADTRCIDVGVPGYNGIIRRYPSQGWPPPAQGLICMLVGSIGYNPELLPDQRLFDHESVHMLQNNNIFAPYEFLEPQATAIADIVIGDGPGYPAIKSYCDETINLYWPFKVFYDLCNTCGFDKDKESLFWSRVDSNPAYSLAALTQVYSELTPTKCTQTDVQNIFIKNNLYQCSNGIDDNMDGLTDLDDPNCVDDIDESEYYY